MASTLTWWLGDELGVFQEYKDVHISVIYIAKNQVCHSRMKHLNIQLHFIRRYGIKRDIFLRKIETADNQLIY